MAMLRSWGRWWERWWSWWSLWWRWWWRRGCCDQRPISNASQGSLPAYNILMTWKTSMMTIDMTMAMTMTTMMTMTMMMMMMMMTMAVKREWKKVGGRTDSCSLHYWQTWATSYSKNPKNWQPLIQDIPIKMESSYSKNSKKIKYSYSRSSPNYEAFSW